MLRARRRHVLARVGLAAAGAFLAFAVGHGAWRSRSPAGIAEAAPLEPSASAVPVLVELFTSEGCSSCPPADVLARELVATQRVSGAHVVLLAHHVDYWNDLGWPDPFSTAAASARQRAYAGLGAGTYTPQAVINGRAQATGSDAPSVERAIGAAARLPHVALGLTATPAVPARGVYDVAITVPAMPSADADVVLAVVQDHARIDVPRGENRGRTLEHTAIVRRLTIEGRVAATGSTLRSIVHLPAAVGARERPSFSLAAFVQERSQRHVLGSTTTRLP